MIAKFIKGLTAVCASAVMLTGCGSDGGSLGMASEQSLAKIKELVLANVDTTTNKIYRLMWHEDTGERKLENVLTSIDVYYTDSQNDDYTLTIDFDGKDFVAGEPRKSNRKINSYELSTPHDLDAISYDFIHRMADSADSLVVAQPDGEFYELKSVEMFSFGVDPVDLDYVDGWHRRDEASRKEYERLNVSFQLNYIRKDEATQYNGRYTTTNYYTVPFRLDEAGEVYIAD